ncbi:ubiquinol-cytochrome c reductase core subunit 1 [Phlyctochytrium planicorne]|nr:ubiquinol-cytochrome c reductase core subunit 1 [Phlyctochytrium planicorne]
MFKCVAGSAKRLPTAPLRRNYAIVSSSIDYNRKGDQPAVAPTANKTVSKAGGVSIATIDGRGPVSSVSVVVAAGSRYESLDAPGAAHFLKTSLFRSVAGDNLARSVRELELRGDTLDSTLTREHLIISSTFLRDNLVDVVPLLAKQVFNPSFQPYEFLDAQPFVLAESASALADPVTEVVDKLHQVAFRTGLGNSLFASPNSVNGLKRAHLQELAANTFTADRIAIVGTGVSHEELSELVESSLKSVSFSTSQSTASASQYFGGEARIEAGANSPALYAIGFKSTSYTAPQYAASVVLRALLDGSKKVKWGVTGSSGLLASSDASVVAFNSAYSDAGIFGLLVKGSTGSVKAAAQKGIDTIKSVASSVSSSALESAKKGAILEFEAAAFGSRDAATQEIAKKVLSSGNYATSVEFAAAISKVTAEDVSSLAKSLLSSKPSVVARGNLLRLPYADELKF